MKNADKFKAVFGLYATELWSMPEGEFLKWLNSESTETEQRIIDRFMTFASAQPERKTGKWEFIGDNMFKCTSCGVVYTTNQLNSLRNYDADPYAPKFCPSCGADMREKNERLN